LASRPYSSSNRARAGSRDATDGASRRAHRGYGATKGAPSAREKLHALRSSDPEIVESTPLIGRDGTGRPIVSARLLEVREAWPGNAPKPRPQAAKDHVQPPILWVASLQCNSLAAGRPRGRHPLGTPAVAPPRASCSRTGASQPVASMSGPRNALPRTRSVSAARRATHHPVAASGSLAKRWDRIRSRRRSTSRSAPSQKFSQKVLYFLDEVVQISSRCEKESRSTRAVKSQEAASRKPSRAGSMSRRRGAPRRETEGREGSCEDGRNRAWRRAHPVWHAGRTRRAVRASSDRNRCSVGCPFLQPLF
jgi:hypothetical protein